MVTDPPKEETPAKWGLDGATQWASTKTLPLHLEGGVSARLLLGFLISPSPLTLLLPSGGQGPPHPHPTSMSQGHESPALLLGCLGPIGKAQLLTLKEMA